MRYSLVDVPLEHLEDSFLTLANNVVSDLDIVVITLNQLKYLEKNHTRFRFDNTGLSYYGLPIDVVNVLQDPDNNDDIH